MGIVAPVTGVIAALIPVAAGIVLEGVPPPLVLVGIALAIVAVVLVSRVSDDGRRAVRASGSRCSPGSGSASLSVCISQISDGHAFGPLVVIRATQALLIGGVILVTRAAWRPAGGSSRRSRASASSTWPATARSSWRSRPARWPSPPSCRRSTR